MSYVPGKVLPSAIHVIWYKFQDSTLISVWEIGISPFSHIFKVIQWPWIKVKVIMSYVPVKVLPFATIWYRFQGSTGISDWKIGKSPFFHIFKVTLWPWPWLKVTFNWMLWKVLPQTTLGPSLVTLLQLVSEILSMFKFSGRRDGRTDVGGSFYRLDHFCFTREPPKKPTYIRSQNESLLLCGAMLSDWKKISG